MTSGKTVVTAPTGRRFCEFRCSSPGPIATSIRAVLRYLDRVDPEAARQARIR